MPYTRAQLLAAFRQDHPQLANVPDNQLFAAIAQDSPELARGASEFQQGAPGGQVTEGDPGELGSLWRGAKNFAGGAADAVRSLPQLVEAAKNIRNPHATLDTLNTIGRGLVQQGKDILTPTYKALPGVGQTVSPEEYDAASRAGGNLLGGMAIGEGVGAVAKGASKIGGALSDSGGMVARLDEAAAANKAGALNPTTLTGREAARNISPELVRVGAAKGIRGKTIDRGIMSDVQAAGARVSANEARVVRDSSPEMQTSRNTMLTEIDDTIQRLDPTINANEIATIQKYRDAFVNLPEFTPPDILINLRRRLDKAAEAKGAFKDLQGAERVEATVLRGMSDIARRHINTLDDGLRNANHEFWLRRKAADIVDRRQLGEYGNISSGLPGRGSLLDDLMAGGIGNAIGGPVGAVAAEGLNLARQSRGWANVKSGVQSRLADALRVQQAPQNLLGPGQHWMPAADESGVTAAAAARPVYDRGPANPNVQTILPVEPVGQQIDFGAHLRQQPGQMTTPRLPGSPVENPFGNNMPSNAVTPDPMFGRVGGQADDLTPTIQPATPQTGPVSSIPRPFAPGEPGTPLEYPGFSEGAYTRGVGGLPAVRPSEGGTGLPSVTRAPLERPTYDGPPLRVDAVRRIRSSEQQFNMEPRTAGLLGPGEETITLAGQQGHMPFVGGNPNFTLSPEDIRPITEPAISGPLGEVRQTSFKPGAVTPPEPLQYYGHGGPDDLFGQFSGLEATIEKLRKIQEKKK